MSHRILVTAVGAFAALLLGAGCGKTDSQSTSATAPVAATNAETAFLKFHWLGKKNLAAEANATNFMAIWNLPESVRLEAQTFDKLSTAPWRLWATNVTLANAPVGQLQTMLEDLIQEEFYIEAYGDSNRSVEFVLATRLPSNRAAQWHDHLPLVFQSCFNGLQASNSENTVLLKASIVSGGNKAKTEDLALKLSRAGEWTIFSACLGTNSPMHTEFEQRIARAQIPYPDRATNYWVEFSLNAQQFNGSTMSNWSLPTEFPNITVQAIGDGNNVRTWASLTFPREVPFTLENWNIPTNLIADPLVSFTALQGTPSWLQLLKFPDESLLAPIPNQLFLWSLPGIRVGSYFAAPEPEAAARVQRLTETALTSGNQWLELNAIGTFVTPPRGGLGWQRVPFSSPFLIAVTNHHTPYLFGGMFPVGSTNRPLSPAVIEAVLSRTNLVYYDWELAGPRLDSWTYLGQLLRVIFQKAQLPRNAPGLPWLSAISSNLTTAVTVATLSSPREISVVRRSTIGLTAFELQLLVDWLESPKFPVGLHTFTVEPEKRLNRRSAQNTNAPPASAIK